MANRDKQPKKPITSTGKNVQADDRYILPNLLIQQADEGDLKKFSDYNLDRDKEIIELLSGAKTSKHELTEAHRRLRRFFLKKRRDHVKTFIDELYTQWRRLRGWDKLPYAKHHKPIIFAIYTKRYVYGRFPREVLPILEELNDYIAPGIPIRPARHFQWLSKKQYKRLKEIIQEVIDVCKTCQDMYEFRVKYGAKYGVPFQLSIFRDNDGIVNSI